MPSLRSRWNILLLLLAVVFIALLSLRTVLQPKRLSSFLLTRVEHATGLELSVERPADIGLWPDLHIELYGLTVQSPGSLKPLLRAERVELVLPWSSLRDREEFHMGGIRLISPHLDVPELLDYLDHDKIAGPPSPVRLPSLDAPLELRNAHVFGDGWSVEKLRLSLPSFHDARPTTLDASGNLVLESTTQRFALHADATPTNPLGALRLEPLDLNLQLDSVPDWRPHVSGMLEWHPVGGLHFDLRTYADNWPAAWPALPFSPAAAGEPVEMTLRYEGDAAFHGLAVLSLTRGDDGVRGHVKLNDTLEWLGNGRAVLPPLVGELEAPRLEIPGVQAHGVRLRIQESGGDEADGD